MIAPILILCYLSSIISYKYYKNIYNPVTIFFSVWSLIFTFYKLNPYHLLDVNDQFLLMIFGGLLSFLTGCLVIGKRRRNNKIKFFAPAVDYKKLDTFLIVLFIFTLIPSLKALNLILHGVDLHDIRYIYHDDIVGNGLINIVFVYFCNPFSTFMIVFSLYNYFFGCYRVKYLMITIADILLIVISTGGRFYFLYFIASLAILIAMCHHLKSLYKIKKTAKWILILGIVGILVTSIQRGSDIIQTIFVYPSGCIPFLDIRLFETENYPYTLGITCLNGLIRPIFVIVRKFLDFELPLVMQMIETVSLDNNEAVKIGPDVTYNSFVSIFFNMYRDGGALGIYIISFIVGLVSMKAYKNVFKNNARSVMCYVLVSLILILSFYDFIFSSYQFALSFVYLFILVKKNRYKQQSVI